MPFDGYYMLSSCCLVDVVTLYVCSRREESALASKDSENGIRVLVQFPYGNYRFDNEITTE